MEEQEAVTFQAVRSSSLEPAQSGSPGLLPGALCGLVLAGANRVDPKSPDDGILTGREVAELDLRGCELATLSACDSGGGRTRAGEVLVGLRRALRLAGVRCVVSSLWKCEDEAARELMISFYKRLWADEEESIEAALRGARLEQLERNRKRYKGDGRPSTWGAFILDWQRP